LLPENFEYLDNLPPSLIEEGFTLVHGSPRQPIWEYILYPSIATSNFAYFDTQICFVGHTHTPVIFRYEHLDSGGTCLPFPLPQVWANLVTEILGPAMLSLTPTKPPSNTTASIIPLKSPSGR
jgi:hypothetical protein